jgi:hypothetical protein
VERPSVFTSEASFQAQPGSLGRKSRASLELGLDSRDAYIISSGVWPQAGVEKVSRLALCISIFILRVVGE